jgi:uncharacterized protein YeeX (DUF496 family)
MSADGDTRRVHFHSPEQLIERVDAIATLVHKDRTAILNDALREYVRDTATSDEFQQLVANEYYEDRLDFETTKQLVGAETAQRFRLLKRDLNEDPLELAPPSDTPIYDDGPRTVEPADTDTDSSSN